MRDDLQELVDEVSRVLAAPATLEDADFTLLAFCAHDDSDGLADDPESYGGLSIEDDEGGTVDPAEVAGTASTDDDTVTYAPEHSEAETES